jgi:hypothetical protein
MTPNLKNLSIDLSDIDTGKLVENWVWLIGSDKHPIIVTNIGDMFLKDEQEHVYWLNAGEGDINKVADSISSFEEMLLDEELVDEWFLPQLEKEIKESGLELADGKLFGYKKLPILGGDYAVENFKLTDVVAHFQLAGEIHRQIADLPEGTPVNIKVVE